MHYIDNTVHKEFPGLHTPEEFTKACTGEELMASKYEDYSVDFHQLFREIQHGTVESVQSVIQQIAQYPQLKR